MFRGRASIRRPPGIGADLIRVLHAEGIHEARGDVLIDPGAFHRQEAAHVFVSLGRAISISLASVVIADGDHVLAAAKPGERIFQKGVIEAEFVIHPVLAPPPFGK